MPLVSVINFLKQVDELDQAKDLLITFAKHSDTLEQFDQLGMLCEQVKAFPESLQMLKRCFSLAQTPEQLYAIRANLAKVYNHLNEPDKSLLYSSANLKTDPNDFEALMEQSFSYYIWGVKDKSYEIQKALIENPNTPEDIKKKIIFNLGSFEIAKGNFKEGINKMIAGGKNIGLWKETSRPYPKWRGELTNKTVLVYAEAGIGDEFINIRFMKHLVDLGIKAKWIGFREDLVKLFKENGFDALLEKDLESGEYTYCDAMMLPVLLRVSEKELWYGPYIHPKQEFIDKWKAILPEKFITIKHSGNSRYEQDLHRSIDINLLYKKLPEDIATFSLQIEDNSNIKSWDDTLAIQHLAYLNITSCTSTAHSASASGARCVVLPPIATYYPWLNLKANDTSQWYGENTKVYPQTEWRNWEAPIDKVLAFINTL